MANNITRFKKDLANLQYRGMLVECAMVRELEGDDGLLAALGSMDEKQKAEILKEVPAFSGAYEKWYSESIALLSAVLPERLVDFRSLYEIPKTRKDTDFGNYVIADYLIGLRVTYAGSVKVDRSAAMPKLRRQIAILSAVKGRFESSLFEIRQLVQADLFDSEISAARELLKNKFLRGAGAIAGVVIEKHLAQVCADHDLKIIKKNPGIADLNEALKAASVIDVPQWRHITLMGDYRNLCDHNKQKEPSADQVSDLLDGADKILKTIV
jgi:hypothetical protein